VYTVHLVLGDILVLEHK